MRRITKGLFIITCFLFVFVLKSVKVSADTNEYKTWNGKCIEYFEQGDFRYFVSKDKDTRKRINGEVWIQAGYEVGLKGNIKIPDEVKKNRNDKIGYNVVGICSRGFDIEKITGITIGSNVKEIGHMAFWHCDQLKKVTLPAGLLYLGEGAFDWCTKLKEISIPNKVKTIENSTFRECTALEKVTMKKSVTKIGDDAFSDCYSLKKVTLSKQLKEIGNAAFIRCRILEDITLPNTVTSIGDHCFNECESIKKLIIPSGITKIGIGVFSQCLKLEKVVMGDKVTEIGNSAFGSCHALTDINVPGQLKHIGDGAFSNIPITEFDFPSTLKTIGSYAFAGCENLREAIIPEGVTEIGESAFTECASLTKASIPSTVKIINRSTFYLTGLSELKLSEGLVEIGDSAFGGLSLYDVTIPKSVKILYSTSFYDAPFIRDFYRNQTDNVNFTYYHIINGNMMSAYEKEYTGKEVNEIGDRTFFADERGMIEKFVHNIPSGVKRILCNIGNYYTEEVNLPDGVEYIDGEIFGSFEELKLPSSLKHIKAIKSEKLKSLKLPNSLEHMPVLNGCTSLESVTIPEKITGIGEGTFANCTSLKKIIMGGNITELGEGVFAGTAITSFEIPDTVKTIGNISYGTPMDSVVLPSGIENISWEWDDKLTSMEIKEGCKRVYMRFNNCTNLEDVILPSTLEQITDQAFLGCTKLTQITLPAKVVSIGSQAFLETGITDVKIPKGCTYIGPDAFNRGTTIRIQKDSKLQHFIDEYKNSGYKVVTYK